MSRSSKYMELNYREVSCQKAVSGSDFVRGNQDYYFSVAYPTTWIPACTFFKMDLTIVLHGTQNIPTPADNVALSENAANNLYNNVYLRLSGQEISSIINFSPQASILKHRYGTSGACLRSVKASAEALGCNFFNRQMEISNGAVFPLVNTPYAFIKGENLQLTKNNQSILFQPPIAIFDYNDGMPSGEYRFSLNPQTDLLMAAQSIPQRGTAGDALQSGSAVDITINDVKLYVCTATVTESIPRDRFNFKLGEILIQSKPFASGSTTYDFQVPASTYALAWFLQQTDAGTSNANVPHTVPVSRFRSIQSNTTAAGGFVVQPFELTMSNYQITYSNQTKPSTRYSSQFTTWTANPNPGVDTMQLRYMTNLVESSLLDNPGGAEKLEEYFERGPYFLHSFIRDKDDKSTQVQLAVNYTGVLPVVTTAGPTVTPQPQSIFLAALYYKETEVIVENGRVQSVRSLNV